MLLRETRGRAITVLALTIAWLVPAQGGEVVDGQIERWRARAARTTITRDDFGVPHISAPTDADAVFALMYAQAEDDFPRIEHNFLLSQGRLAEAEGEQEIWRDLRMRLFIDPDEMRALYAESPPFLRALMDAWADGLNFFLHTHPQVTPRVIERFEPWMALTFSEGSIGGDIERIDLDALREFYDLPPSIARHRVERSPLSAPLASGIRLAASAAEAAGVEGEPVGSNGIAIAPARSASDAALLLINPHTSFFFRHEAHVTSAEGLNAYGALTWGQFFVYQGFNPTAGWMHTSSSVDNIDEFAEEVLAGEKGLAYRYGDVELPVQVRRISVPYRTQQGMAERTFTTYRTHHGPVVRSEQGRWVAVALMEQPMRALMQSYLRTKAMNLADYLGIMSLHTNSSNNTVFADAEGNIAYLHSNFVPVRNPDLDYRLPVDGADPASDWQGLHSIEESPNTINPPTGWLQNTNNWPYSAAGPGASPRYADYPSYMDIGTENPRGVHALALLSQVEELSLEDLVALAYDPALPAFDQLLPGLFQAYDGLATQDARRGALAAPIEELRAWDRRWSTDSVATSLAMFWADPLMRDARAAARAARQEVIAYMAQSLESDIYLAALQAAVDKLREDFGAWQTPWGEINRFQRLTGDIAPPYDDDAPSTPVGFVSGRWGSLASFGAGPKEGTRRWYGTGGNSFVAVVEFAERVRAVAVTAGGLSRDPASPHFNDQARRYAQGRLRPVYFWPDELAGHIERRYRPGQ
ncbi:MAG: penicillin acylase family protein [Pseudomonadota bacterium]